ncbi:hypothetical protein PbDSM24746_21710 [Paenibacillus macerans]|nr:hypothetical protein PbDSM24746_21710 [Paenibacillus macerans]
MPPSVYCLKTIEKLYYEQENFEKAADELTRAYMGAGMEIFMEDDPKYLEFLETNIEI